MTTTLRRAAAAVFVLGMLAIPAPAGAQTPTGGGDDRAAAAEDLFQRGKALLLERKLDAACPMLLESYRLDPAGGTLQNLAVCYEEAGRWASAYARFQELRALSKSATLPRADRVKLADEHIARLTPRLSRIVLAVPADVAADASVEVDGVSYREPSWASGIVVDPGPHEIVVAAAGKLPFRTTVTIPSEGSRKEIAVPVLEDAPRPETQGSPSPAREHATVEHPARPRPRTAALVVGAAGLGVLIAGGVFGALTFTTNGAAKDKCSATTNAGASRDDFDPVTGRCFAGSPTWKEANAMKDDARTFANVANVLVPVGVVGLGVAAYLLLRSDHGAGRPAAAARGLRLSPWLGGASLEGAF